MKLTIISTSDMHGYIYPTDYTKRNLELDFSTARAYSAIEKIREQTEGPVITVDNGDFIQGSPLSYVIAKNKDLHVSRLTAALNKIEYDAGILGNHEFNYGIDYLDQAVDSYDHEILCANILKADGTPRFGKPYKIFEKSGVKIAILGLTTQYIPHWENPETVKGLKFVSAVEMAKKYVPMLREQADVVIVSYHGGFEKDPETGKPTEELTGENEGYALLTEVPGIDALISGHTHQPLAGKLNNIPFTQPKNRAEYVGKITLDLKETSAGFEITDSDAEIIPTGKYEVAPEIADLLDDLENRTQDWLDQTVGVVEGDMHIYDSLQARLHETPYIEFINKVQMEATNAEISVTAIFKPEASGFNNEIKMRDVITNYIYPNTLVVERVTGQDLKNALERSASFFVVKDDGEIDYNPKKVSPKPRYYNYDMYEGIDYELKISNPFGSRVTKLEKDGQPIQMDGEYEIVLNQYRGVGGGNYSMYSADKIVREVQIDMTELIANYLIKHPVIKAEVNNNFVVVK